MEKPDEVLMDGLQEGKKPVGKLVEEFNKRNVGAIFEEGETPRENFFGRKTTQEKFDPKAVDEAKVWDALVNLSDARRLSENFHKKRAIAQMTIDAYRQNKPGASLKEFEHFLRVNGAKYGDLGLDLQKEKVGLISGLIEKIVREGRRLRVSGEAVKEANLLAEANRENGEAKKELLERGWEKEEAESIINLYRARSYREKAELKGQKQEAARYKTDMETYLGKLLKGYSPNTRAYDGRKMEVANMVDLVEKVDQEKHAFKANQPSAF